MLSQMWGRFHIGQLPIPRAESGIDSVPAYCVTEFGRVHFPTCQVVKNKSQHYGRISEAAKRSEGEREKK